MQLQQLLLFILCNHQPSQPMTQLALDNSLEHRDAGSTRAGMRASPQRNGPGNHQRVKGALLYV